MNRLKLLISENWGTILILTILVIWGGFLRTYKLGEQSLWIDEGYTINASQGIVTHGYPLLNSGRTYDAHPFHNYITAGSMKLFGFDPYNPWSARLPAAIFGILSILTTFFVTKRITKNTLTALAASALIAFSYWEIAWSRQARGYTDMQFFIILAFGYFYTWLDTKKIRDGILAFLFIAFSYFSHGVALIFIPSFFILFIMHTAYSGKIKDWLKPVTLGFLITLAGFGIWIIYRFLPPITTYAFVDDYASFLTNNLKYITLGAGTIVLGVAFWVKRFWRSMYIAGIIIPTLILIMFYSQVIQMRYLLTVFPFLIIAGTYGLYLIIIKINIIKKSIIEIIFYTVAVIALGITFCTLIPVSHYKLEIGSPQPNFKGAYTAINSLKKDDDIIISPYTHLSKIYLQDRGLWLPITLTGKRDEIIRNTINNTDYYTGAPIITDGVALQTILDTSHGYIVIDTMARIRIRELFNLIKDHPRVGTIYYNKNATGEEIAVYSFGFGPVKK